VAIGGGPAASQTNGTFNLTAILALNYLVGGVGRQGGVILNPPSPLAPASPGVVSAFKDWQELADRMRTGQPRPVNLALFRGVNPVYNLPASDGFAEALARVGMVVSFASVMDETAAMSDLVLPEHTYLEDWGDDAPDPGPGYQLVGYQQPVVLPVHDTRSFGDILLTLAQEIGPDMEQALPWKTTRDLLREGAKQIPAPASIANWEAYWNSLLQKGGWWDTSRRHTGAAPKPPAFRTPATPAGFAGDVGTYPLHLLPFASHSLDDGRGAHLPWLQATPDPLTSVTWETWVEVGRATARQYDLEEGMIVALESSQGRSIEAPVYINPALPPGLVAVPLGQGHTSYGRYAQGRGANVLSIVAPQRDEDTGALAWSATRVRLTRTARRQRIAKFEGTMFAEQVPGSEIIEIAR